MPGKEFSIRVELGRDTGELTRGNLLPLAIIVFMKVGEGKFSSDREKIA